MKDVHVLLKSYRQRRFKRLFVTDLVSEYFLQYSFHLHAGNFDVPFKVLLYFLGQAEEVSGDC
jgi:hypothetical protein